MTKISYGELKSRFSAFNNEHEIFTKSQGKGALVGIIVFDAKSFTKEYSLEARSYEVSSDNKAFIAGQGGYSIFANSLDGSDVGVRLEQYMKEEKAGPGGWVVDYCYLKSE